jgi:uncharacterized repeat protein (TIGR03803 family)
MSETRFAKSCTGRKVLLLAGLLAVLLAAAQSVRAQYTYDVLYTFQGTPDGANPFTNLVLSGKSLFGTTVNGGANGLGTVFNVTTTKTEKWLYSFNGPPDGANPYGGLILVKGSLYGTSIGGGVLDTYACSITQLGGCGTIFEITTKSGKETVLYRFAGAPGDGENPYAGLVSDPEGNLYGTTNYGGANNEGTVFEFSSGTETPLYSFSGNPHDGAFPEAPLIRDSKGDLYGTTADGGGATCAYLNGCGTVFEVTSTGEMVLYPFQGPPNDGGEPRDGLVKDAKGNLYGSTHVGGTYNFGTVFELKKKGTKWSEVLLYSFQGSGVGDGSGSTSGLIFDKQGNLYGTTTQGGTYGYGTVYELSPEPGGGCPSSSNSGIGWCETVLYSFTGGTDGANPNAGLIFDKQGNLYGTTYYGGGSSNCSGGCGVVFKLIP